jgi:guanylate kinase
MNKLIHLEEVEQILADYHPSEGTLNVARELKIAVLCGVSSSGRNTIIRELVRKGGYHDFVTDTTRQPRVNNGVQERDGVEYHFRSEEEFLDRLREGKYLEAAILHGQQISGISVEELEASVQAQTVAVGDFDNAGAKSLLSLGIDCSVYFLVPPSFGEWTRRMTARGLIDQEEIRRRLISAERELQEALEDPRFVIAINDQLQETVERIDLMIKGQDKGDDKSQIYETAWRLLNDLKQTLHS